MSRVFQHFFSKMSKALLRSEILSRMCTKLRTAAASNNRDHVSQSLIIACSRHVYIYIFVLHAHPICGESRNQHKMICMQNGKQKWYVNSLACHVVNIKAMKFFAYLGKNLCLRATPAIRAVESEVLSSDSGSGQFRLSDSNSASRLPPTFSCISYLKW